MKVAFRADASTRIGSGHVIRCLTLADALRQRGALVRFVCCPCEGHLGELIERRGFFVHWIADGTPEQDARDCREALKDEAPWDWLVVDHYARDARWERELRDVAGRILAIDDVADRRHDCDVLLDQNLQEPDRYRDLVSATSLKLLGPEFALLRPQFAAARKESRVRNGGVSRILVFFGGSDAGGETVNFLSAFNRTRLRHFHVDVVVGSTNPNPMAVQAVCAELPAATVHYQVANMAKLMVDADLFVGAGGTSSWERCCLGLPGIVVATADNQVAQSKALAVAGAHLYVGLVQAGTAVQLANLMEEVTLLPELVVHMAERGHNLVDGDGTRRVLGHMLQ